MESGPTPEDEDDLIPTALRDELADDVKVQVANAMAAILELFEEYFEQLFQAATLSAWGNQYRGI